MWCLGIPFTRLLSYICYLIEGQKMRDRQAIPTAQQLDVSECAVNQFSQEVVVFFAGNGRKRRRVVLPASRLRDSLAANLDRLSADFYYEE